MQTVAGAVVAWLLVSATMARAQAPADSLIDFKIKDQFKEEHSRLDYLGRVVLVVASNKGGSEYNEHWSLAIEASVGGDASSDSIAWLPVADVRGVPFFLKRMVRGGFPKAPENWVLTDWKGRFAKAYALAPGVTNMLVFGRDGRLVHRASGREVDAGVVRDVASALRSALG